jgi:hypothetical protein
MSGGARLEVWRDPGSAAAAAALDRIAADAPWPDEEDTSPSNAPVAALVLVTSGFLASDAVQVLLQRIDDDSTPPLIPVRVSGDWDRDAPDELRNARCYDLDVDGDMEALQALIRRLIDPDAA